MRTLHTAIASLLASACSAAGAQEELRSQSFDVLMKGASDARSAGDAAGYLRYVKALQARYPQFAHFRFSLARAHAMNADAASTAEQLEALARLGFTYSISEPEFDRVRADVRVRAAQARLQANQRPVGRATRIQRLDLLGTRPEGIAYSRRDKAFYVGSVETGKIFRVASNGRPRSVYEPVGAKWEPLGITVAPDGRRLFACLNRVDSNKAAYLAEFAWPAMKVRSRPVLPAQGAVCNDLTVLPDGRVLLTDFANGQVLLWSAGKFSLVLDKLDFANGVAVDPEHGTAFVAHMNGIKAIDLRSGDHKDLEPVNGLIGGIDGLYWHKKALYGVQGTVEPVRIAKITPQPWPGTSATVSIIYAGHGDLREPTTAALVGDELAVLSRTGLFSGREQSDPVAIFIPLDSE